MINLKNIKNQKYSYSKFVETLFYTFPLSFIAGNLVLSLHLLLFIIASFLLIKKENLALRFNKSNYLIFIFFLYLFLSTAIQFPDIFETWVKIKNYKLESLPLENHPIFKSFLLIRFIIFVVLVDTLFFNKILNIKKIFYFSLICTTFVSFDIIIQYIFGSDLFGNKNIGPNYTGPFGDERISGSFLQKFSIISFFAISFINFNKRKLNNIFLSLVIVIHSSAILLSGNRMNMVLFLFGCFLLIVFIKNFRFVMSLSLIAFSLVFFGITASNDGIRSHYSFFLKQINVFEKDEIKNIEKKKIENNQSEKKQKKAYLYGGHGSLYKTSIEIWKTQPIFGFGLKSFRFKCWEILSDTKDKSLSCSTHPHNYYLEILIEAGIIGSFFIIFFIILILKDSFLFLKKNYKINSLNSYVFMSILITFCLEIWPLKSTGSFFTTWNATFFWLIVSIILSMISKKKLSKN
tara:strand:+ start:507 stop:1892 length:1386 start_codon:yes stop_codon:yes gene_type:complete